MDANTIKFLDHVNGETQQHGVKVLLPKVKYLVLKNESNVRCNGFFDQETMTLKVAINKSLSDWLSIFVHEYSHFQQWNEKSDLWNLTIINGVDRSDDLFNWIKGKELPEKTLQKISYGVQILEFDCEKRSVKNIKRFSLPINIETYIQKANAYVYFYNWITERRLWYKRGHVPYEIRQVIKEMPKTLKMPPKKLPKKYMELFDQYCV